MANLRVREDALPTTSGAGGRAWRAARRAVAVVVGGTVVAVGLAMTVLPGPATVVVPLGLGILATEFMWARKLLDGVRSELARRTVRKRALAPDPPKRQDAPVASSAINTLVLAGTRRAKDPLAEATGAPHRALVSLAGRPLLAHVLGALRRCESVGRISVSMDEAGRCAAETELPEPPDAWERGAGSPVRSVLAHLDRDPSLPLLITTADHALLTPSWVQEFLTEGLASGADLVIGVVSAAQVLEAFPSSRRTVLRFSDEPLCGANLFLALTPAARRAVEFWVHAEAHRKTPWKLIGTFGATSLLRFVTGRLRFEEALEIAGKRLGVRAAGVRLKNPEAAIDVDRMADLELAEAILRRRGTR